MRHPGGARSGGVLSLHKIKAPHTAIIYIYGRNQTKTGRTRGESDPAPQKENGPGTNVAAVPDATPLRETQRQEAPEGEGGALLRHAQSTLRRRLTLKQTLARTGKWTDSSGLL